MPNRPPPRRRAPPMPKGRLTESPSLRAGIFAQPQASRHPNRLTCLRGGRIASPDDRGLGRPVARFGACVRALGLESLSTLSQYDRSAGRRTRRSAWQPRTELSEGAFFGCAMHRTTSPSRTAESIPTPSAPSSSRFANPGEGRGVSRLRGPRSFGHRHLLLEDGVHYAEAPSSVVPRHFPTKERLSYP